MNHLLYTHNNNSNLVDQVKEQVLVKIKQRVAPEFINRIDDIIMFLPLSQEDIKQIV
jgi:ATP-dependent Clp protease ATP-binding subunit ClpB